MDCEDKLHILRKSNIVCECSGSRGKIELQRTPLLRVNVSNESQIGLVEIDILEGIDSQCSDVSRLNDDVISQFRAINIDAGNDDGGGCRE